MHEIISGTKVVNGEEIETWKREIYDANVLEVEAGTNGYKGGDTGHGSRTFFSIKDCTGTDITAKVLRDRYGHGYGFSVELGGDCELTTIIKALKFIVKVLKKQSKESP